MRVIHIINNLAKGGAEKLLTDTLPFFKAQGVTVKVLLLSKKDSAIPYLEHLQSHGIEVSWMDEGSVYNPLKIVAVRKYLLKNRPDLVHVHLFPAMYWAGFAIRLGLKIPTVFTEHSNQNRRFNNPVFRPIDRMIYKGYDKIIAISPAIADKLRTWTGLPEKITVIRNGVDTSRFKEASSYHAIAFRSELNLPTDSVILMMTARFAYPKNHKTIVDALMLLPDEFIALFVGEGEGKYDIENYVNEKGLEPRVRFLGFRTDIPQLMKTADINILSSEYEGMSGVTCEALAAGRPFLGSDVAGINDVVPHQTFLFAEGNATALAQKLERISADPKCQQQMIAEGQEQVQQFDTGVMVAKTLALYQGLLKARE